jgi:hypothetical protein
MIDNSHTHLFIRFNMRDESTETRVSIVPEDVPNNGHSIHLI